MLLTWNMFTGRVIPKSVELKTGTRGGIKMDRGATKMRQDGGKNGSGVVAKMR